MNPDAVIVLASGLSRRFGAGNKLLAELGGQAVLAYALETGRLSGAKTKLAVTPRNAPQIEQICRSLGFDIIENTEPEKGQSFAVSCGAQGALDRQVSSALLLLGDMPFVDAEHCRKLSSRLGASDAVFSRISEHRGPPAVFSRSGLIRLAQLSGKNRGKDLFDDMSLKTVSLSARAALDIDTQDDLVRAREHMDG